MKKILSVIFLISAIMVLTIGSAMALSVTITRVSGYYTGDGGEFSLNPSDDLEWVLDNYDNKALIGMGRPIEYYFQSFCLERTEGLSLPGTYDVALNDGAVAGGGGSIGGKDIISVGTAWLYSQFGRGVLDSYDYNPLAGRSASAGILQNAIWMLEDELPYVAGNYYADLVTTKFTSWNLAKADNAANGYGVAVLNLTKTVDNEIVLRQDQLVLVPEPLTLVLLGFGLVGLAGLRRKL